MTVKALHDIQLNGIFMVDGNRYKRMTLVNAKHKPQTIVYQNKRLCVCSSEEGNIFFMAAGRMVFDADKTDFVSLDRRTAIKKGSGF